ACRSLMIVQAGRNARSKGGGKVRPARGPGKSASSRTSRSRENPLRAPGRGPVPHTVARTAAPRPGRPGALASTGRPGLSITGSEVLLNEPRAEVDVQLDERAVADAAEAVDLARLDHEDVAGFGLELLPFHVVEPA